jgi:hypothetical protein
MMFQRIGSSPPFFCFWSLFFCAINTRNPASKGHTHKILDIAGISKNHWVKTVGACKKGIFPVESNITMIRPQVRASFVGNRFLGRGCEFGFVYLWHS